DDDRRRNRDDVVPAPTPHLALMDRLPCGVTAQSLASRARFALGVLARCHGAPSGLSRAAAQKYITGRPAPTGNSAVVAASMATMVDQPGLRSGATPLAVRMRPRTL